MFCHNKQSTVAIVQLQYTQENKFMINMYCFIEPKTCQDVGCCNNASVPSSVEGCQTVHLHNNSQVPCNSISYCCKFQICLHIIFMILIQQTEFIHNQYVYCPLLAQTCAEAKFRPGFCKWQFKPMRETCQVYHGNCYCDPYCACFGDCCQDVQGNYIANPHHLNSLNCYYNS